MRGVVVIPDVLADYPYYDYNMIVARMFGSVSGFPVVRYSRFDRASLDRTDVLISVQAPSNWCQFIQDQFPLFGDIPPRVRFVLWIDEIQFENAAVRREIERGMDRADLLLTPVFSGTRHMYPRQAHKVTFLPWFAADRFAQWGFNGDCQRKALAVASGCRWWYPFRHVVETEGPSRLGDRLVLVTHPHVRRGGYVYDDYVRLLRDHLCVITGAGTSCGLTHRFDGSVRFAPGEMERVVPEVDWAKPAYNLYLKLFEIPCAGSLLVCDGQPLELAELGFRDGENYVRVTKDDVFDRVADVLDRPEAYEAMRRRGMELVRGRHMLRHRLGDVVRIFRAHGLPVATLL